MPETDRELYRGKVEPLETVDNEANVMSHFHIVSPLSPFEAEEIVAFFERVASEEGWSPGNELRAHLNFSTFFGLWQKGQPEQDAVLPHTELVAGLQLVRPDENDQLPCDRIWPELTSKSRKGAVHVSMLAVSPSWRGKEGGLFWLLTAAMWNHCVRSGIRELWLEATPRTMRCYRRLGWPLQVQGELREHWGEPCFPCSLSIREVAGALAEKAVCSDAYQQIMCDMLGLNRKGVGQNGLADGFSAASSAQRD